ncbi:MAG: Gfo/Idh/MocA family oxidoreductase [Deltaproteobacteria bacterium]|nr:Gfo/Idh/MocA family oxidoreductase [Deltaproteobacteria bacterium]
MNIGVVGCGSIATAHVRALQEIENVKNIYVFDIDSAKAMALSNQFGKVGVNISIKDMISKVDGIIIATPNNTHLPILKEIISIKPIPILCEKPLASSLPDAREIQKLAPPLSCVGFNYRFNHAVNKIFEVSNSRKLGNLIFADIGFNKNSAITKRTVSWRDLANQQNSSGAFGDLSSHLFDLVSHFSKSPIDKERLKVSLGTKVKYREGVKLCNDDHSIATGVTESGVIFRIISSKAAQQEDLGFYLNLVLDGGELNYSSTNPKQIKIKPIDEIEAGIMFLDIKTLLDDPENEIAYWSDSLFLQDKEWLEQISSNISSKMLAGISNGLHIQELIFRT